MKFAARFAVLSGPPAHHIGWCGICKGRSSIHTSCIEQLPVIRQELRLQDHSQNLQILLEPLIIIVRILSPHRQLAPRGCRAPLP